MELWYVITVSGCYKVFEKWKIGGGKAHTKPLVDLETTDGQKTLYIIEILFYCFLIAFFVLKENLINNTFQICYQIFHLNE